MSKSQSAIQTYAGLSPMARHLLQLCAVYFEGMNRTGLVKLSNQVGWTDASGKPLVFKQVKSDIDKLVDARLLVQTGRSADLDVNPELKDFVVQEAIREGQFEAYAKQVEADPTGRNSLFYLYTHGSRKIRDMRIAFYRNDVERFNQLNKLKPIALVGPGETLGALQPFHSDMFDRLDPELQGRFLVENALAAIVSGEGTAEALQTLESFVGHQRRPEERLVMSLLDVYVARGDLQGLLRLAEQTGGELTEIAGCEAFLRGDYERAESHFEAALTRLRKKSRKRRLALRHMAGLFHVCLLIRKNSPAERKRATSMLQVMDTDWPAGYKGVAEFLTAALKFQAAPADAGELFRYQVGGTSIIAKTVAGYVWRWFAPRTVAPVSAEGWQDALLRYQALGLDWIMAETAGFLAHSKIKQAKAFDRRHHELHEQLGTVSLLRLIEPEARWQRSLKALMQLHTPEEANQVSADEPDERLIWEVSYRSGRYFNLRPFLQKRNKSGAWTKGRPVALKRLYESHSDRDEFPQLTEQDHALCRCIKKETSYGGWGRYADTDYFLESDRAAAALVGHPLVFREDDRSQPIEIVRLDPQLVVAKKADGKIHMSLQPRPGPNAVQLTEEGPNRLGVVNFTSHHVKLDAILDSGLTIPASGQQQVVETLQAVAPLVTVHSEIGGAAQTSETIDAESRPHVHLTPYQEGVWVEFFVRPFGPDGPFYRPGAGGENVYAQVGGQAQMAHRDLREERRRTGEIIAACPALSEWVPDLSFEDETVQWDLLAQLQEMEGFGFPTAGEALELMLQLQPLLDAEKLTLHWPTGGLKTFRVVGEAGLPQLRLHVRKDRDWFAASGALQVDDELTVDLLQLMEWLESGTSRFVELEDGQFLALTDELRRRIGDLAAYAEKGNNKLRFPPIRAAVLEDLDETGSVKTDRHWKNWVHRIRESSSYVAEIPSTLQAELRDYQAEGYHWLCRLAHWGAGACLADDMGLGKTIQALALLLHRTAGGPALVVTPTSVMFNWQHEARRFAPALNLRLFGPGDREAFFDDLGSHDVVVCSYGLLNNEAERFQLQHWHTVILDEAQAIKNMTTQRSQAVMGLAADFRLIMTGTPLENHLGELWNLFQFINPGLLGAYETFQWRFATPIERDHDRDTRRRLQRLVQPFMLRRTKAQVLEELPSRTEVTLQVELSREEAAFYEALRQNALQKLSDVKGPQHLQVLAEIMRLRRACCHPRLAIADSSLSSSKLRMFGETIDELLENKHKVLVFSQFVDHLTILREALDRKGVSYQYLDGSTPARARDQRVAAFQAGEGDVFLISLRAGGIGLNLTAADYVIHMDPWWNPAVEDQASDRAHRLGQQRPVTIYRFVTQGTIEERIVELHHAKRDLADSLLEGADMSSKLSAEELLQLIRE
ncbi:DEAD/DEAH box helicase [Candidatus Entotheonella palauensis]|uniref:DEAD/DEAH box helicase n=1 Tax=Candidatus Entotheonella palauensis TaxID=93172 RepID=UPI000B7DA75D|nr:DEAD/DEAH box helicase [Candidatus Entotheonella palauensis]